MEPMASVKMEQHNPVDTKSDFSRVRITMGCLSVSEIAIACLVILALVALPGEGGGASIPCS